MVDKILLALKQTLFFIPSLLIEGFLPAIIIAGLIKAFVPDTLVTYYLSKRVSKLTAYMVAAISGVALTICACGVIPLFAAIMNFGAGIGPAFTFLFAGPAINPMAIVLTFKMFGVKIAVLRLLGAFLLSILIGFLMEKIFANKQLEGDLPDKEPLRLEFSKLLVFFEIAILMMIFGSTYFKFSVWIKLAINIFFLILMQILAITWLNEKQRKSFLKATLNIAKQILIPLIAGLFVVYLVKQFVSTTLMREIFGKNTFIATLFASILGAPLYFGTCVSVVVLRGLMDLGMATAPALALFLSGPSVSFPSILAINNIAGFKKNLVYTLMVVIFSALWAYLTVKYFF